MTKRMKKPMNHKNKETDTSKTSEKTGESVIRGGIRVEKINRDKGKQEETDREEVNPAQTNHSGAAKEIDVIEFKDEEIEETGSRKNGKGRIASVLLVFLCTILLAVVAGFGLALWDLGKTPSDVIDTIRKEDAEPAMAEAEERVESVSENAEPEPVQEEQVPAQAESLVQTDETANIAAVVRAGDEDVIASKGSLSGDAVSGNSVSENEVTDPNEGYPRAFTTVDLSYFDDALFIGDSRMEGFGMHSGTNATFYATKGFQLHKFETMKVAQTEAGKAPIFDVIPQDAFTKIYIKVGLNEMGWGTDQMFLEKYAELIARLRVCEPRAIIYVHALLPVTAEKSAEDSVHSNENIAARNELLKQFAQEQQAYYIGINSVVSAEDGSLKPEMTTDGIHLKAQYMDLWREYLRTHAVELLQ
ncbi:MAG: GDSL-type esterase/lipase family protein [Lachnospiraceae bacterium]